MSRRRVDSELSPSRPRRPVRPRRPPGPIPHRRLVHKSKASTATSAISGHPSFEGAGRGWASQRRKRSSRRGAVSGGEKMAVREGEPVRSGVSLSDMVLGFFEQGEGNEWGRGPSGGDGSESSDQEESKAFWETQHQLLREALSRKSSAEAKIRMATEDVVKEMQSMGFVCNCSNRAAKGCRNCALRRITESLREAGYDSALCKSKWRRSLDIPSGEHSYVDVMMEARINGKIRSPIRVVIEINFRAEFEMARASPEYKSLVNCLPVVFAGKSEKLKDAIRIMCSAAKRCAKDNNMHLGPWRKHKYMQSKWLGTPERTAPQPFLPAPASASASDRQPKLRASMLTFDLHRTAVEVV